MNGIMKQPCESSNLKLFGENIFFTDKTQSLQCSLCTVQATI